MLALLRRVVAGHELKLKRRESVMAAHESLSMMLRRVVAEHVA